METKNRCKESVWHTADYYRGSRCARNAVCDGYCKQHHPDSVKARSEKAKKLYEDRKARDPMIVAQNKIVAQAAELSTLRDQVKALTVEREAAVKALKIFVDDALYLDLGGGDAVGTSCESLEAAKEALDLIATANPQT